MKRRAHEDTASHRRPQRMVVPDSASKWVETPVYELDWDIFLEDVTINRIPRPLPSSTVMASLVPASQGMNMPLLQHLRPLMKGNDTTDANNDNTNTQNQVVLDAIDDPSSSTLTRGQHARYLQLESGSESWNEGRRKEFHKLSRRVKQEQQLYRQALEVFWEQHSQMFKNGLESHGARYCMTYAKLYQSSYDQSSTSPQYFGPCSQVISLQHVSHTTFTNSNGRHDSSLTLDSLKSTVVHQESGGDEHVVADMEAAVPVFTESKMPSVKLLQDDSLALKLANEHNVSIVTTKETLETLLQVSGDESTRWMIPVTKSQEGLMSLDLPVPQPTTPRECVSRGVTEGLYHSVSPSNAGYTYTVLTLPTKSKPAISKTRKVLVRSRRRVLNDQQQPLCIHTHLEYFPSHGLEEFTSYERASWILDSLLGEQSTVARVDPSTMKVIQWEQVGVAHALAFPKNHAFQKEMDPMHHLESLVEVLHAMETLAVGHHLLCLPPSSTSISVHRAFQSEKDEMMVDVMEELKRADAVYTGAAALRQCARVWRWNEDRFPFTFPISDKSKPTR